MKLMRDCQKGKVDYMTTTIIYQNVSDATDTAHMYVLLATEKVSFPIVKHVKTGISNVPSAQTAKSILTHFFEIRKNRNRTPSTCGFNISLFK